MNKNKCYLNLKYIVMEEAIIILKRLQNELVDDNTKDAQNKILDINKVIEIISNHKCFIQNAEILKLNESIKKLKEENIKLNINKNNLQIEIDKLNCVLKKYKQELPKYRNDKNNEQESNDNWYICEANKSGEYRILGDKFVENNKSKGYLIINGQKTESLETHANLEEGKIKS
jgi:hypothetical protein